MAKRKAVDDVQERMRFGKRLREAREARGLSIEQLGKLASITLGRLDNWEAGRGDPSVNQINRLTTALGIEMAFLILATGPRDDPSRFGVKLRAARMAQFGTIKNAAAYLKLSRHDWQKWERGLDFPPLPVVLQMCHKFDVSLDWLVTHSSRQSLTQHRKERVNIKAIA